MSTAIKLPVRVNVSGKIRGATDADGGWSVVVCENLRHVRQIMRDYPRAEMPCWKRFAPGGDLAQ